MDLWRLLLSTRNLSTHRRIIINHNSKIHLLRPMAILQPHPVSIQLSLAFPQHPLASPQPQMVRIVIP